MFRATAGQTITRAITVSGSGSLTSEAFEANIVLPSGRRPSVSASITDAAAREVTVTMEAREWERGNGGEGQLELRMIASGTTTVERSERFRVMRGLGPQYVEQYV